MSTNHDEQISAAGVVLTSESAVLEIAQAVQIVEEKQQRPIEVGQIVKLGSLTLARMVPAAEKAVAQEAAEATRFELRGYITQDAAERCSADSAYYAKPSPIDTPFAGLAIDSSQKESVTTFLDHTLITRDPTTDRQVIKNEYPNVHYRGIPTAHAQIFQNMLEEAILQAGKL